MTVPCSSPEFMFTAHNRQHQAQLLIYQTHTHTYSTKNSCSTDTAMCSNY